MHYQVVTPKVCPLCGRPMQEIEVTTAHRDYKLWTCVPCVKEGAKQHARQKGNG